MNYTQLGRLGIGLALLFWLAMLILRHILFGVPFIPGAAAIELALMLSAALVFWWWIARRLRRIDAQLRAHSRRLETLHQAGLAITTERDLADVLQSVVDQSRILIGARYGALGVVEEPNNTIHEFVVSGLDADTEARLRPHPPAGHGILGLPIIERRAIRVDDISAHPASVGFPPHHPPMQSFLGVPVISKGTVFGHLYLTDKMPPSAVAESRTLHMTGEAGASPAITPMPFSEEDQQILKMFATQAAIAIENARLYRQSRELAVLRERERFGMDLHDGVIQSIYAVGLLLDDGLHRLDREPETSAGRMREATQRLNHVIGDIRRYIYDLRSAHPGTDLDTTPQYEIEELAQSLRTEAGLHVNLNLTSSLFRRLTPRRNAELVQIVSEATANIRRHAHARHVEIILVERDGHAHLEIRDDGQGFDYPPSTLTGEGLGNMSRRAQAAGGTFALNSAPGAGCQVSLTLPLESPSPTASR